jgi:CheY-like chemotaxis protein
LLDLAMPRLDGWGVLASLRTLKNPPRVIVLSSEPDLLRAKQEGAYACLSKPFRPAELLLACREALSGKVG